MFVDSHAHLTDKQFESDRDEVINRARQEDVNFVIAVGESIPSSLASLELAQKYDFIYAAVGIHPHHAQKVKAQEVEQLKGLSKEDKVVAVGEIGLDYYYDFSPQESQRDLFAQQLKFAEKVNLPVIIHNRQAEADCLSILKDIYSSQIRGVMHCFSGDEELARECLDLGLYISFAGQITFPKADNLRRVVGKVPLEKMLIETDCPYLAPQEKRGKRNEPVYLKYTAEQVAQIKGVTVKEVAGITAENARILFDI